MLQVRVLPGEPFYFDTRNSLTIGYPILKGVEVSVVNSPPTLVYELVNGMAVPIGQRRIVSDKAIEAMSNLMSLSVGLRGIDR
ncbi:MAG: hypothetical protein PHP64_03905 [Actinomycetota bacterium]|nr:hypothetical protein [Actinomycetota bacterium]